MRTYVNNTVLQAMTVESAVFETALSTVLAWSTVVHYAIYNF